MRRAAVEWNAVEEATPELHVVVPEGGGHVWLRLARDPEHLVGHVDAEHAALRPDTTGRDETVDACARAQVDEGLA